MEKKRLGIFSLLGFVCFLGTGEAVRGMPGADMPQDPPLSRKAQDILERDTQPASRAALREAIVSAQTEYKTAETVVGGTYFQKAYCALSEQIRSIKEITKGSADASELGRTLFPRVLSGDRNPLGPYNPHVITALTRQVAVQTVRFSPFFGVGSLDDQYAEGFLDPSSPHFGPRLDFEGQIPGLQEVMRALEDLQHNCSLGLSHVVGAFAEYTSFSENPDAMFVVFGCELAPFSNTASVDMLQKEGPSNKGTGAADYLVLTRAVQSLKEKLGEYIKKYAFQKMINDENNAPVISGLVGAIDEDGVLGDPRAYAKNFEAFINLVNEIIACHPYAPFDAGEIAGVLAHGEYTKYMSYWVEAQLTWSSPVL